MADLNEQAAALRRQFIDSHVGGLDVAAATLESPLEHAIFWAFCCEWWDASCEGAVMQSATFSLLPGATTDGLEVALAWASRPGGLKASLWPQVPVSANGSRYRLDFALVFSRNEKRVLIDLELDGHEFHERTKKQAARDKKRDRDLQSIGWHVARFTGAEVYANPRAVVDEVCRFGDALLKRAEEGA
jgi:very-short-patch-repair endonuclease